MILSGSLSDGSAGLVAIKARGGVTIVQDPADALIEGMPTSAIQLVEPDYVLTARDIGIQLARLDARTPSPRDAAMDEIDHAEQTIERDFSAQRDDRNPNQLTMYTCPDCGGAIWQVESGKLLRFQCHVGHAWGPEALLGLKSDELESALWSSVRLLRERSTLSRQVAVRMRESGDAPGGATRIEDQANLDERRSVAIREMLEMPLDTASRETAGNLETGG